MTDISKELAFEIADNWEQMASTAEPVAKRETLRECADLLRMTATRRPLTCPRAERNGLPFYYCDDCDGSFPCELPESELPKP